MHFDVADIDPHWIPGHPVASNVISLLNVVLPAAERWFVDTFNEALPLVKDPKLADDMRGFIGQEATHADVHEQVLHEYMVVHGIDPAPILDQIEYVFEKILAPSTSTDPKRRLNHLCDRLWLIAAIEHYTAVMGDFALNCAWDDHSAHPTMVDLFRWHGSEEVEHRTVAHDVAVYFHDSYVDRIRAMSMAVVMIVVFFQRAAWYLVKADPGNDIGFWRFNRLRMRDSKVGLLPKYRKLSGSNTPSARVTRSSPHLTRCWPKRWRRIRTSGSNGALTSHGRSVTDSRVCMQQTGQTRRECRRDIRASNGVPPLP